MTKKYQAFSTQNLKYYDLIGRESIRTFLDKWPKHIDYILYAEEFVPDIKDSRLIVKDWSPIQYKVNQYLEKFNKSKNDEMYKFWLKSFAWLQGTEDINCDFLIWLDSDIITDKAIDESWLDTVIDQEALITDIPSGDYLKNKESETGFAVLNKKHQYADRFIIEYQNHYDNNTIDQLHRQIDSAVWWNTVKILEPLTKINHLHTSEDHWGPFKYTVLAERLSHWISVKNKRAWASGKKRRI